MINLEFRIIDAIRKAAEQLRDDKVHQVCVGEPDWGSYQLSVGYLRALNDLVFNENSELAAIRRQLMEG